MNKQLGSRNVIITFICSFIILGLSLVSRLLFWNVFGQDLFGTMAFVNSMLAIVSFFTFGLDNLFTFGMMRGKISGDDEMLAGSYHLARRAVRVVIVIKIVAGFVMFLWMPRMDPNLDFYYTPEIISVYFVLLGSLILDTIVTPNRALIMTERKSYIFAIIETATYMITFGLKIVMLLTNPSVLLYALIVSMTTVVLVLYTSIKVRKDYKPILLMKHVKISKRQIRRIKRVLTNRVYMTFGDLLGTKLTDIVTVRFFGGVSMLAIIAVYQLILRKVIMLANSFVQPLQPMITMYVATHVTDEKDKVEQTFVFLYIWNMLINMTLFLGSFAIINPVVSLLFNDIEGGLFSTYLIFLLVLRGFVLQNRNVTQTFARRAGFKKIRRWTPLIEGILVAGFLLMAAFIPGMGLEGIFLASTLTALVFRYIVDVKLIFNNLFHKSCKKFLFFHYCSVVIFLLMIGLLYITMIDFQSRLWAILINGTLAVLISAIPALFIFITLRTFRNKIMSIFRYYIDRLRGIKYEFVEKEFTITGPLDEYDDENEEEMKHAEKKNNNIDRTFNGPN